MSAWGVSPDNLSKYDIKKKDGEGIWLVRYQYDIAQKFASQGKVIDTTRIFCKHMVDRTDSGNRVYKREVLEDLRNPEFGSYNIFWYKGSYNCRHVWKRKIYFKSYDSKGANPVGNVPYVVARTSDKRATTVNERVKK